MIPELPSLNAVRVFECAARLLSFSQAAEELHVTQSAVSRQIRVLEDQLGQPLFRRSGPHLSLTDAGVRYHPPVLEALSILRRATAQFQRAATAPVLTVSVLPTFASRWLVPRISVFEQIHPEVALRLAASHQLIDFDRMPDIDAAIRMGLGSWPGVVATRLTALHVFPVCSPNLARQLKTAGDLAHQRLLADDSLQDEWPRWFKAAGIDYQARDVRHYDDDSLLLRAAIEGQGVTLARVVNAQDDLDSGRLVKPFELSVLSAFQYFFVCPSARVEDPAIKAFSAWIQAALG